MQPEAPLARAGLFLIAGGKLFSSATALLAYTFHAHGNTSCVYKASEIDVLAAYVMPVEAWYLFPVEEFRKYKSMKLFPASRRRRSKFEKFREAWSIVS